MYKRIMVGVDGSEHADKAVDHAIELCKCMGAELIAVNIISMDTLSCMEDSDKDVYCRVQEALEKRANNLLDKVEKKANKENVLIKKIVQVGDVADTIVELAKREDADLIVVGTRGLLGVKRVALGSHAEKIARWASVPVLIVR
ncbi:MAG: universal stress protein [Candidatus Jordarchaeaceae archaeon]